MSEKHIYDEYKVPPQLWGWVILVLFAAAIVSYGMWLMMIVPDAPRYWDHGERRDTPAESIYSTYRAVADMDREEDRAPSSRGQAARAGEQAAETGAVLERIEQVDVEHADRSSMQMQQLKISV